MTLLTYQVFKTVTEQGSFRKAADLLGLTPSAVSHAVYLRWRQNLVSAY